MIRFLALIARKPETSRESFREHYETVHAPLGMSVLKDIPHYLRNHVTQSLGCAEPPFDVLSEFGYADIGALKAMTGLLAGSELGDPLRADELTFMDRPRNVNFALTRIAGRSGPAADSMRKLVLLGSTPGDSDREAYIESHVRLLDTLGLTVSSTTYKCPVGRAPYDVVSFLRCPADGFDAEFLQKELLRDEQALLLQVDACATRVSVAWDAGDP